MILEQPDASAPKPAWRAWAKARRAGLEPAALSPRLVAHLEGWADYRRARHVLLYLAFGSEIGLEGLDLSGKRAYSTRSHLEGRRLSVHPLGCELEGAGLERHALGFLQPAAAAEEVDPRIIDLALVPGLLFDLSGERLGYGLGFYDRFLPRLRPDTPRLGVTADALVVERLPAGAHDVPVTHLLSESGIRAV